MLKKFLDAFGQKAPVLFIILIWFFLVIANYEKGFWLSGWDNLHPEFNLSLNIKRSLSAAWQEYQGVGLVGGMGHAADLPRQIFLYLVSFFVADNNLRFFWTFLMLLAGPLGVYFFIQKITKNKLASLTSSVFYLLNLATLQYFYVPFETFTSFYGIFPWLIYFSVNYLESGKRKDLLKLLLVSFLGTPAFYVQTLFVVLIIVLIPFVAEFIYRYGKKEKRRVFKLLLAIFAANSYWLLPVVYFTITNVRVVLESKINLLSTHETQLMNQGFGSLKNIALLKGFWLEYLDAGSQGGFGYLMESWKNYTAGLFPMVAGYFLFLSALAGFFLGVKSGQTKWVLSGISILSISLFSLLNGNAVIGPIHNFLADNVPLLGQVFRSTFTKWSIVAAFSYAWGLGIFVNLVRKIRILNILFASFLIFLTFITIKPVFSGELISSKMKVKIPSHYFELFDFFPKEPKEKRIAFLPVQSFWGWNFYDWGYRGSGFLWYGIEQPILDRAFDVWSADNETFYQEISTAIYGRDQESLSRILEKYDVSYLILDTSVFVPGQGKEILKYDYLEKTLAEIGAKEVWKKDFLRVYDISLDKEYRAGYLYSPGEYSLVQSAPQYLRKDFIFEKWGNYADFQEGDRVYPFSDLYKEKIDNVSYFRGISGDSNIKLDRRFDLTGEYEMVIPPLKKNAPYEFTLSLSYKGKTATINFDQKSNLTFGLQSIPVWKIPTLSMDTRREYKKLIIAINGQSVELENGQTVNSQFTLKTGQPLEVLIFDGNRGSEVDIKTQFSSGAFSVCWTRQGREGAVETAKFNEIFSIKTRDASGCLPLRLGETSNKTLLEFSLPFKSTNGAKPHFCIVEEGTFDCLNDEIFYKTPTSKDWNKTERKIVLDRGKTYWVNLTARPPDSPGLEWTIEYNKPEVIFYPLIGDLKYESVIWNELFIERRLPLENSKGISLTYSTNPKGLNFAALARDKAENCDILKRGKVEKELSQEKVTYTAHGNGTSCDFAVLDSVSSEQGFLVRLVGEGKAGRGLKYYLFNKGNARNDLEIILSPGRFDSTYSVLPWTNLLVSDYILNFETRSVGNELTKNVLEKVETYKIPIDWISTWYLERKEIKGERVSSVGLTSKRKSGTWFYQSEARGTDHGLIVLSQGYSPGWLAFDGYKKLKHAEVNSWANGWVLPKGDGLVTIFFWPQLLEYLGFSLLVLGVGFIFFQKDDVDKVEDGG